MEKNKKLILEIGLLLIIIIIGCIIGFKISKNKNDKNQIVEVIANKVGYEDEFIPPGPDKLIKDYEQFQEYIEKYDISSNELKRYNKKFFKENNLVIFCIYDSDVYPATCEVKEIEMKDKKVVIKCSYDYRGPFVGDYKWNKYYFVPVDKGSESFEIKDYEQNF